MPLVLRTALRMLLSLPPACLGANPLQAEEIVQKFILPDGSILYTNRPAALAGPPGMQLLETRIFKDYVRRPRPLTAARRDAYDKLISSAAKAWNLDFAVMKAIMHAESLFDPDALSTAGARGLMQLMPATARELGVRDVGDPQENIEAGARYLRILLDLYGGNMELALAAYNAGHGNVDKYAGIPPFAETRNYLSAVNRLAEQYRRL